MGKKRIKVFGEEKRPQEKEKAKVVKTDQGIAMSGKEHGRITDMSAAALEEAARIKEKEKEIAQLEAQQAKKTAKSQEKKGPRKRSPRYLAAVRKIDRQKLYSLKGAVKLLKVSSVSRFDGSVEVHLNLKESGLKGQVTFPHSTGKSPRVRIADDKLIQELEKGKVDFDVLVASPAIMPKLVKYARLLGPKGLMPNPKAGTVSENPEKLARQLADKVQFRSEKKVPLLHQVIGKLKMAESDLEENFKTLIEAVGKSKIQKAVLTSTMGPGIKVDLDSV